MNDVHGCSSAGEACKVNVKRQFVFSLHILVNIILFIKKKQGRAPVLGKQSWSTADGVLRYICFESDVRAKVRGCSSSGGACHDRHTSLKTPFGPDIHSCTF